MDVDVVVASVVTAPRCEELVANPEPPRDGTAPRVHLFATHAVAKARLALEDEHAPAGLGELPRGDRTGEPAADDDDIVVRFIASHSTSRRSRIRTASAAQHRACRAPSAAATRPRVHQLERPRSNDTSRSSSNAATPRPSIFTNDSFIVHSRTIAVASLPSGSSSPATNAYSISSVRQRPHELDVDADRVRCRCAERDVERVADADVDPRDRRRTAGSRDRLAGSRCRTAVRR